MQSEYNSNQSIDLNLTNSELVTMSVALKELLAQHGVKMMHETVLEPANPTWAEDSHLGVLVSLMRRVDAALHGRKTWNRNR